MWLFDLHPRIKHPQNNFQGNYSKGVVICKQRAVKEKAVNLHAKYPNMALHKTEISFARAGMKIISRWSCKCMETVLVLVVAI